MLKRILFEPAVIIGGRRKILVIADLHLGILKIKQPELVNKLKNLIELNKIDEVIINGDLKHELGLRNFERKIIEDFTLNLENTGISRDNITLVKGNHDGGIDDLINTASPHGIRIGKVGILHGHALPSDDVLQAKTILVAHAHPAIALKDEFGVVKKRIWLEGEIVLNDDKKRIIIMPVFNNLCASTSVNLDRPAGVLFKRWNYLEAEAMLLDGTLLGKVKLFI